MPWLLISIALAGGSPESAGHDNSIPIAPEPVTSASGEPPMPLAIPVDDPVEPPAAPPRDPARARAEADALYLKAVDAWRDGKWPRAWRLAAEALKLEPEHAAARLLAGYALLRMRRLDEGITTLEGLKYPAEVDKLTPEAQRRALKMQRRFLDPRQRQQMWLSVGNLMLFERSGDTLTPLMGYTFAAQVPVLDPLAVRADFGNPWGGTASLFDVRGPRFGLAAVTELHLGKAWYMDLGAGPSFWLAEGGYWPDGSEPYFGLRAEVGIDVRIGRGFGLRWETGFSSFPAAIEDLSWYAEPLDLRLSAQGYFGRPRPFRARR